MNPQRAANVAAGIAGTGVSASLVTLIAWGLSLCHVAMPPEVAVALGSLIATGIHYFFHMPPNQASTVRPGLIDTPQA
jgi:hypothetical protein